MAANLTDYYAAPAALIENEPSSKTVEGRFDSITLVIAASFTVFVLLIARFLRKKKRALGLVASTVPIKINTLVWY